MSESQTSDVYTRLRKLPRQLLLALINGTAILVIVAAVLALIATSRVTHLAQAVASTMTDAVLSRVGGNPRQLVQSIQSVSDDVHTLTLALAEAKGDAAAKLGPEVERLNERLDAIQANLDQLRGARRDLIDQLIAKVGSAAAGALQNARGCPRPGRKDRSA
jgi:predicted PurR-regulated permease PerM